jgi:putative RNA 2'-phosphotransferase
MYATMSAIRDFGASGSTCYTEIHRISTCECRVRSVQGEKMQQPKALRKLAKLMEYVLGRRPDEFGLVPDENGYVRIKDLLKALSEEEGYGHIRRAGINEMLVSLPDPPVEIRDTLIRAKNRAHLMVPDPEGPPAEDLPPLLYTCVRKKAHPVVVEKGVAPMGQHPRVVLSGSEETAKRIGRRFDAAPVLLTVQTARARELGVSFHRAGETLFLADPLPPECVAAPPLPKGKPEAEKAKKERKEKPASERDPAPGSFVLEFGKERGRDGDRLSRQERKRRNIARDKEKKRARRRKQKDLYDH